MNKIHPTAIIHDNVVLGDNIEVGPYTTIGFPPEQADFEGEDAGVIIADNVRIRECVTIQAGIDRPTTIGHGSYILSHAHVGHDASVGHDVTLATGCIIGGHSVVRAHCYIGLNSTIHQRSIIARLCILGANGFYKGIEGDSAIIWAGVPARAKGVNSVGIERHKGSN